LVEVTVASDLMTLDGHGLADDDALLFRAEGGGSLPAELVAGTTYYAIVVTSSTFQVSATAGGAAIDLTTAGARVVVVRTLPITQSIQYASAMVDDFLIAHQPVLDPIPTIVRTVTARLAVVQLLSDAHAISDEAADDRNEVTARMLDRWKKGLAVRGPNAPAAANRASVAIANAVDPRGWIPTGGTLP